MAPPPSGARPASVVSPDGLRVEAEPSGESKWCPENLSDCGPLESQQNGKVSKGHQPARFTLPDDFPRRTTTPVSSTS